jgi:hypothetical protein
MKNLQYTGAIVLVGMGMISTSVFADSERSSESHKNSNTRIEATHQSTSPTMTQETAHTDSQMNVETAHTKTMNNVDTTQTGTVTTIDATNTGTVAVSNIAPVAPRIASLIPASINTLIDTKLGNMADNTSRVAWLSNVNDKIDILSTKVTSQKSKDILSELKDLLTQKIDAINGGTSASSLLNGLLQ